MEIEERRGRRIMDYLNDGEELGVERPPLTPRSSAAMAAARSLLPRFRWARLSRLGKNGGAGGGKGKGKEEVVVEVEKGELRSIAAEKEELKSSAASARVTDGDARPSDHGVGLSLVFLLAKTSDEFNKMVKVRAEMEELLKEIKGQVRTTDIAGDEVSRVRNCESTAASSCLTDGHYQAANVQFEDQATSSGMDAASCDRMDVLEEEFHAEFDRLQETYGSDTPSFQIEEHDSEDDITEYRQEFDGDLEEEVVDDEDDNDDDDDAVYNGVSAVELERRLHELLHQRNQERIEELEAALWCAEKKLLEKEMEACLWKDTAKMALRQDDELQ